MSSISPSNSSALKILSGFDLGKIKAITEACFKCLVDPEAENPTTGEEANAQIGLAAVITVFARQGASADSLGTILRDAGISDEAVKFICNQYNSQVDIIRAKLSTVSCAYPKIVGCEWRLDYSVSNSETGSVLKPLFFVQLKVEDGTSIDFTCNEEEMTTLVNSLKEASAEAQRTKF